MQSAKKITGIVLALMLILAGAFHFVNPEMYFPLTPDFISKYVLNAFVGATEIALGIGVFIPSLRRLALSGICILMIIFLPVHVLDAMKEEPFIGTKTVAYIRIGIQLVLIWLPFYARKR